MQYGVIYKVFLYVIDNMFNNLYVDTLVIQCKNFLCFISNLLCGSYIKWY